MDRRDFDRIARLVGATASRRRGFTMAVGALLTGRLAAAAADAADAASFDGPTIEGPCGNGSAKANRCKRNNQCCTGHCDRKKGRCRCLQAGKSCTEDRECCNKLTCSGGQCVPGKPCTPSNCPDGCCVGDVCRAGNVSPMCGKNGEICVECRKGETCRNQECKACSGCIEDDVCYGGDAVDACGEGGTNCKTCSGSTDTCSNGSCTCGGGVACSGATPWCVSGVCQECASDANCPANEYCVTGVCQTCPQPCNDPLYPYCVQGACAMCRTTADCAGVTTCNNNACCGTWTPSLTFGSGPGSGASQFDLPPGVDVFPYANTLVAAVADGAGANSRIDFWGRTKGVWNRDSVYDRTGEFGLSQPYDISVSLTWGMHICDTGNNRVVVLDELSRPIATYGQRGTGDDEFRAPRGIFVDEKNGYAYVADHDNDRISVWAPDVKTGRYLWDSNFGASGSDAAELNGPYDVAVDGNGTVYVADTGNNRISVWQRSGKAWTHVENFGSGGDGDDEFNQPFGVATASDGRVFVMDTFNQRFSVWQKKSGAWVAQGVFGDLGDQLGEFANPFRIAFMAAFAAYDKTPKVDTVWVADTGNNRISIWEYDASCPG
jgi:DNA-binding beta-propeller fold protein YncE